MDLFNISPNLDGFTSIHSHVLLQNGITSIKISVLKASYRSNYARVIFNNCLLTSLGTKAIETSRARDIN